MSDGGCQHFSPLLCITLISTSVDPLCFAVMAAEHETQHAQPDQPRDDDHRHRETGDDRPAGEVGAPKGRCETIAVERDTRQLRLGQLVGGRILGKFA